MNATQVIVYDRDLFSSKLAMLNRKATKLGLPMIQANYVCEEVVKHRDIASLDHNTVWYRYWLYDVVSPILVLPGNYRLVASIDHVENIFKVVPGELMPELYRERGSVCDHCGYDRIRNKTYVLVDASGDYIQVGSTCLGEFLGIDPDRCLAQMNFHEQLDNISDPDYVGQRSVHAYDLVDYLANVACMIRLYGWTSGSFAKDNGVQSTADKAWVNMLESVASLKDVVTQNDSKLATDTVVWLTSLVDRDGLSDYLHNLRQISVNNYVTYSSKGYAASAINASLKELSNKKCEARSTHLGKVGDKISVQAKLIRSNGFESQYGYTFFHNFVDATGNIIVWKTTTDLQLGDTYQIVSKIKDLDTFNGQAQTIVSRPKIVNLS